MTGYVRQLNEGVQRMFEEMERSGLRDPVFTIGEASVRVTLYKQPDGIRQRETEEKNNVVSYLRRIERRLGLERTRSFLEALHYVGSVPNSDVALMLNVTPPTARSYMRLLEEARLVEFRARSVTDPAGRWEAVKSPLWEVVEAYLKRT